MTTINEVAEFQQPLERRLMIGLRFAIAALNDAGAFNTYIPDPRGDGSLSSENVVARLTPLLREAEWSWDRRERLASCMPFPDEPP